MRNNVIETLLDGKTNKYKVLYNNQVIKAKSREEAKKKITEIEIKEDIEFQNMYKFMLIEKLTNN